MDRAELEAAFSDKTKMFIFNTPNNPLGKVKGNSCWLVKDIYSCVFCLVQIFSVGELEMIADLCKQHNVLCVSDEVYEWLVYDDNQHHRIGKKICSMDSMYMHMYSSVRNHDTCVYAHKSASLPGMWDRTVTIGSAGKTFHTTGWKV